MRIGNVFIRKYKAPAYETALWIVVSPNILNSIDAVEDITDCRIHSKNRNSVHAYTYAYEQHDGKYKVIIFLTDKAGPGVIAHECKHAVNFILGWNGVRPSFTNDEHEAYMLEWVVDRAHRAINQYKK